MCGHIVQSKSEGTNVCVNGWRYGVGSVMFCELFFPPNTVEREETLGGKSINISLVILDAIFAPPSWPGNDCVHKRGNFETCGTSGGATGTYSSGRRICR